MAPKSLSQNPAVCKQQLGRYTLKGQLGEGGFGLVYLARDEDLGRDVAIKLPRVTKGNVYVPLSVHAKERFLKEARAAAKLRHPNIVAVFDRGQTDDSIYIVYEFVPGKTLDVLISEKAITIERSIRLVASIADALSYAASENIVHRDIKPANIMIDGRDRPQVMDFGLAEALNEGMASSGGRIAGTPAYMSPEQARGEHQIGHSTDQYSLAAILYELATGDKAVLSHGKAAIHEVAERASPPLEPLLKLPRDLRCIILRAMNSDAAQRYKDCADFAGDLRAFLEQLPVTANPIGPIGRVKKWALRNRGTALASAVSLMLLIMVAGVSSVAALMLQQRERMLSSALTTTRMAQEQAEANAVEAEKQKKLANEKADLARNSQLAAEEQKLVAEKSLANELKAQRQRDTAEKIADEEKLRRELAMNEASVARDALNEVSTENRSLQYSEWLTKASGEIRRREFSAALKLLAECDPHQRGWEWRWLQQEAGADEKYVLSADIPKEVMSKLKLPEMLVKKRGYSFYPAMPSGSLAKVVSDDPIQVLFNQSRQVGILQHVSDPVVYLAKIDFGAETFQDVTDGFINNTAQLLGDGKFVSFNTNRETGRDIRGRVTFAPASEVWSIGATPQRILQQGISQAFVPSFVILRERNALLGSSDATHLRVWNLNDGKEQQTLNLSFVIRNGPGAITRLADGRIAILDSEHRFHCINPETAAITSGPSWKSMQGSEEALCWDSTGRYVAMFSAQVYVSTPGTGLDLGSITGRWQLIDAETSSSLGELEMPMTKAEEGFDFVDTGRKPPNDKRRVSVFRRRALAIQSLQVDSGGGRVSARDSHGGVWCWRVTGSADLLDRTINDGKEISQAIQLGEVVVSTDGTKLGSTNLAERPVRTADFRRKQGSTIIALAGAADGAQLATIDNSSKVTIFVAGRQVGESVVNGASTATFASQGKVLVLGTRTGEIVTLEGNTAAPKLRVESHVGPVNCIIEMSDLRMVASAGDDRTLRFWDTSTGLRVEISEIFLPETASCLAYHVPTKRLAAFSRSSVTIFRCTSDSVERIGGAALSEAVDHAVFSADGSRLFVACNNTVGILNGEDGRKLFSLPPTDASICALSMAEDNPQVVLANGIYRAWRVNMLSSPADLPKEP